MSQRRNNVRFLVGTPDLRVLGDALNTELQSWWFAPVVMLVSTITVSIECVERRWLAL